MNDPLRSIHRTIAEGRFNFIVEAVPRDYVWRALRLRKFGVFRKGLWGLADQMLVSAANFVTMVVLARELGPSAFGTYVLAFTALMFTTSVQATLITQPHNVLGAAREGDEYTAYTTAVAVGQTVLAVGFGLLVGLAGVVVLLAGLSDAVPLLAVLTLVAVVVPLNEFVRRVLYTRLDTYRAFIHDLFAYSCQLTGLVLAWRFGLLTNVTMVGVLGGAAVIGLVVGVWQIRSSLKRSFSLVDVRAAMAEHWRFGKWLLGGNLTSWVSGQLYPVLTAGLVSLTATGVVRAVSTVLGPGNIVLSAMETMVTPRAATTFARHGLPAFRGFVRRVAIGVACVLTAYALIVAIFAEPILRVLYGDEYSQYGWLLAVIAFNYVLMALRTTASIALRGIGQTSPIFRANLCSAVATLTLGIAALHVLGLAGMAVGIIVNSLIMNVVLWRQYLRAVEFASLEPPVGQPAMAAL